MLIKKYKIVWSPDAYEDLQNIYFYIKHYLKEKNIANNISKKIINTISNLEYLPERYVKVKKSNNMKNNIRRIPVCNYLVVYEVKNDTRSSFYFTYFS